MWNTSIWKTKKKIHFILENLKCFVRQRQCIWNNSDTAADENKATRVDNWNQTKSIQFMHFSKWATKIGTYPLYVPPKKFSMLLYWLLLPSRRQFSCNHFNLVSLVRILCSRGEEIGRRTTKNRFFLLPPHFFAYWDRSAFDQMHANIR